MTRVVHISQLGVRPPVGLPWAPPRLSRAELMAAIAGRPGVPTHAAHIVDDIVHAHAALDIIDTRRAPDGTLSKEDELSYAQLSAPLQRWFAMLGLYPAPGAA
jgi:hypothetical protein